MKKIDFIYPPSGLTYADSLTSLLMQVKAFFQREMEEGRQAAFVRFFLSDAQNQAAALKKEWDSWDIPQNCRPAISIVEQPPLCGCRIAAQVQSASREEAPFVFNSLRLTEEEAKGKDAYAQTLLLFDKYLNIIGPQGLELKTHCVRTWIYVRDIDANYAGMVQARNEVFEREGLSHDTHYIASTGIGGATDGRNPLVAIDFLTRPDIREQDKTYLKALTHLSPTHDYGVAFERGVRLADGQVYISGTASIDHCGKVLHEGDVTAQAGRLLENISVLLEEAGKTLESVPYFIIYLRDISDYSVIDAYMQERFPTVPRILLEARVCRPSWLIEMECEI